MRISFSNFKTNRRSVKAPFSLFIFSTATSVKKAGFFNLIMMSEPPMSIVYSSLSLMTI